MEELIWMPLLAVLMVLASCGDSNEDGEATADNAVSPSAYFQALEGWSTELVTRMDASDQEEPGSDDPQQHAEHRRSRRDALVALDSDLAKIEPAAETTDAHLDLLEGLQGVVDLEERIIESLQTASSASELFNGPLSGEIEVVSGRLLRPCIDLIDVARGLDIQVELFCGSSED